MPASDLQITQIICAAGGSVHSHVNPFGETSEAGKGIIALQPVPAATVLVSVPVSECLFLPQSQVGNIYLSASARLLSISCCHSQLKHMWVHRNLSCFQRVL